ncbi:MAG: cadherin repeat domain-containing protein [Hyphomicrobiaceae bacterium]|nr:cadherin repeat domain-containing protein [Hyphomicrobiaceae bacterium]
MASIGYYSMFGTGGEANLATAIVNAGHTAVDVSTLSAAELSGLNTLIVLNSNNSSYSAEYLGALGTITNAIASGMTLVVFDRAAGNLQPSSILPGASGLVAVRQTDDDVSLGPDAGSFTNGANGALSDTSLDGGTSSYHGYLVPASLPVGSDVILTVGPTDPAPGQPIMISYPFGAGTVIYSTIPADFYLANPSVIPVLFSGLVDLIENTADVAAEAGNSVPQLVSPTTATAPENTTAVLDVQATDDSGAEGAGLTYAIVLPANGGAADGAQFAIDPATGALTFIAAPNFEAPTDTGANNVYNVTVRVTDSGGRTADQTIAVTITDANEAPTSVAVTALAPSLSEGTDTSARVKVADIAVTDDALGTETLTLSGADAALFEIDGAELFLKAGTTLNFQQKPFYDVTITATDASLAASVNQSFQ